MMGRYRFLWVLWGMLILIAQGYALDGGDQTLTGDAAAEKYAAWAEAAMGAGRWTEALVALERGADFSDISSDISYLLALARSHEKQPRGAVLEAVRSALATGRWTKYSASLGRLLEAENLIALRNFSQALNVLEPLPGSADSALLRLRALKGLADTKEFRSVFAQSLEIYPRDPRFARLFLEYATDRLPEGNEGDLLSLILKRLPALLNEEPELAYLAAPFIGDPDEARRLLGAYRAKGSGQPSSISPALNLGLIDEAQAIDELFVLSGEKDITCDKAAVLSVWKLLRTNKARDQFKRRLANFSGTFIEDTDRDGYPEVWVRYKNGMLLEYVYDADQDGLPELSVFFLAGVPVRAELVVLPEAAGTGAHDEPSAYPVKDDDRLKAILQWEQYPYILEVRLEGIRYKPKTFDFLFAPVRFRDLTGGEFWYPERASQNVRIAKRTLMSFAILMERPSREFEGAVERVELERGIPQKAQEFLNGRLVSETVFRLGWPVGQRIDLDLDGRLETLRRFRSLPPSQAGKDVDPLDYEKIVEFAESDWDGDGKFEYGEQYVYPANEGSGPIRVLRSWDIDKDGIRGHVEENIE